MCTTNKPSSPCEEIVVNLIPLGLINSLTDGEYASSCATVFDSASAEIAAPVLSLSAASLASLLVD